MKWRVGHLHMCSPLGWPRTATLEFRGSESEESAVPRTDSILFTLPPVNTKVNMKMSLKHNENFLYQGSMNDSSAGDIQCLVLQKFSLINTFVGIDIRKFLVYKNYNLLLSVSKFKSATC